MSRKESIQQDLQRLEKEKKSLERSLSSNDDIGKRLVINSYGGHSKWFVIEGKDKTYLPKAQRKEAARLAKISWQKARLIEVTREISACQHYLRCFKAEKSRLEILLENPEFCTLLGIHSKSIEEWKNESFSTNPSNPGNLKFKTNTGLLVRSKSELIIAMTLDKYGIPYRYECLVDTPAGPHFPDFMIMHPKTKKIYLWEHFGLMDNSSYSASAGNKIGLYMQMGYIPGETLIMTFENGKSPLDLQTVETLIQETFM